MLKGGLALHNSPVGVQEDCSRTANRGAVHSAHGGHAQISHIKKALNRKWTWRREEEVRSSTLSSRPIGSQTHLGRLK